MMNTTLITVNSALGGPLRKQSSVSQWLSRNLLFQQLMAPNLIHHIDLYPHSALHRELQISRLNRLISQTTLKCLQNNQRFMIISSDHSSAMGTWAGVLNGLKAGSRLGLIWLDAHLDAHTFETSPSGNCHGMPVAALLGAADKRLQGLYPSTQTISASQLILIGARSYETSEFKLLEQTGAIVIPDLQITDFKQTFATCFHKLDKQCTHIGISLDLDLIDPEYAPAVATPVKDGITATELLDCLSNVVHHPKWCGFECTEWIPEADDDQRTLQLILKLIELYCCQSEKNNLKYRQYKLQTAAM